MLKGRFLTNMTLQARNGRWVVMQVLQEVLRRYWKMTCGRTVAKDRPWTSHRTMALLLPSTVGERAIAACAWGY
jgi:hypothetical protein